MGANGVAHHVVGDDLEGVLAILRWLAYVPACTGEAPPVLATADPLDRPVGYTPAAGEKLDPRAAIAGRPASGMPEGELPLFSFRPTFFSASTQLLLANACLL